MIPVAIAARYVPVRVIGEVSSINMTSIIRSAVLRIIRSGLLRNTLFFSFFFIPLIIYALHFSLPPSRNSDPESYSSLFFPLPTTVRAFHFMARRLPPLLPSSTRVELCLPTLGALSSWSFSIFANRFTISPRWYSNLRINASNVRG